MGLNTLANEEREKIFGLFAKKETLKFNEIEKALGMRSNMVSYHLDQLRKEGVVEKKLFHYRLSKSAEKLLPSISQLSGRRMSPLPIILTAVVKKNRVLLLRRSARPYQGYWGLPGGKVLLEESLEESSQRIMKEKAGIETDFKGLCAIMHERVHDSGSIKHGFMLFLARADVRSGALQDSEYGELQWFDISELEKEKVIPSDYWLIRNKLNSSVEVQSAVMNDDEGMLEGFSTE